MVFQKTEIAFGSWNKRSLSLEVKSYTNNVELSSTTASFVCRRFRSTHRTLCGALASVMGKGLSRKTLTTFKEKETADGQEEENPKKRV